MAGRPIALGLLLVLAVTLAGCNVKDWYNQVGTVRVEVQVLNEVPSEYGYASRITDFENLRVTLRSAQVRQQDAANPISTPPMTEIHDFVDLSKSGRHVLLLERGEVNMRGFSNLNVKIEPIDGVTASGERLAACEQGVAVPRDAPPCIRYQRGGSYALALDPTQFRVPRGGTLTIVVPFTVGYTDSAREYFVGMGVPRAETS